MNIKLKKTHAYVFIRFFAGDPKARGLSDVLGREQFHAYFSRANACVLVLVFAFESVLTEVNQASACSKILFTLYKILIDIWLDIITLQVIS